MELRWKTQPQAHAQADSVDSDKDSLTSVSALRYLQDKGSSPTGTGAPDDTRGTTKRLLRSHTKLGLGREDIQGAWRAADKRQKCHEVSSHRKNVVLSIHQLLELGVFEGRIVECRDTLGNIVITGVVNAAGLIECGCAHCRGRKAIRFNVFEEHAGQKHSRGQHIYLCNGTSLKDFVMAYNSGFVDNFVLDDLHRLTGSCMSKDKTTDNKSTLAKATMRYVMANFDIDSRFKTMPYRSPHKKSKKGRDSNKNKRLFTDEDSILKNGERVAYKTAQDDVLLRGVIEKPGILCECCQKVVSCSQFEAHAGRGSRRAPYENIYLESGLNLKALAESAPGTPTSSLQGNCNFVYSNSLGCSYCKEKEGKGKLISCDACPQLYHAECLGANLKDQKGDWLCLECRNGSHDFSSKAMKRQVVAKCRSLVRELDFITGGCILCHLPDFSRGKFCAGTSILCDQCEREFHVGCLEKRKMCKLKSIPKGDWFCDEKCRQVHDSLKKIIFKGRLQLPGSYECEIFGRDRSNVQCRNLDDALVILQESFDPLADVLTGVDLLPKMVHAETFNDHDYTNIHTILLKHNSKPVCAAVLRICGQYVAELPFIATKIGARKQGHCRKMMEIIQGLLSALSVDKLCLPSADKAMDTWIKGFGFHVMDDDEFRQVKADFRILVFPGTTVLAKNIVMPRRGNVCMNMFLKFV